MKALTTIILIGPMGSGKTTIGKSLAQSLGMEFYDSDNVIVDRSGAPISWIFEIEGEAGFRLREHKAIDELTQLKGVLSVGGGAILRPDNRALMASRGYVIYLKTSVDQQLKRLRKGQQRPLLDTEDPHARLTQLMDIRAEMYAEIADYVLETDNLSVSTVNKKIVTHLQTLEVDKDLG